MLIETLKTLFTRDLNKLKDEISLYQKEENLWRIDAEIANSGGNLCLHLVGNINHFIGTVLGNTGYVRDRPFEFAGKDVPRTELILRVEQTIEMIDQVFGQLNLEDLEKEYPIPLFKTSSSTEFILVHLASHLTYHLGQLNYHRRLLDA